MTNHKHNFEIILKEIMPDNSFRMTRACSCGVEEVEISVSGDWKRGW